MVTLSEDQLIVIGKVMGIYGLRGTVRVQSYTDPEEAILVYQPWLIEQQGQQKRFSVVRGRVHGKGLVVDIEGYTDREQARELIGREVKTYKSSLPLLANEDFYWHQLEGLMVENLAGENLGNVLHVMATGANDVLVVRPSVDSLDDNERLIPYLPTQGIVQKVDIEKGVIKVDWDSDF